MAHASDRRRAMAFPGAELQMPAGRKIRVQVLEYGCFVALGIEFGKWMPVQSGRDKGMCKTESGAEFLDRDDIDEKRRKIISILRDIVANELQ